MVQQMQQIGKYRVDEIVGTWAGGYLLSAFDRTLGTRVLLKTLSPEQADEGHSRLMREAHIMASLNHPNINRAHEFSRSADIVFLAVEWLEGKSLAELVDLDFEAGLRIVLQVLNALEAIHRQGIVHGAISSCNVFVCTDGCAKITGFSEATLTHPNEHGDRVRHDLVGVGRVLQELFEASLTRQVDTERRSSTRNPAGQDNLRDLIDRALQDPPGGYEDVQALRSDLEEAISVLAPAPTLGRLFFSWLRRISP